MPSAPTSANLRYRPDGFHSSASDASLQAKYGHSTAPGSSTGIVVPPPPTAPSRPTTATISTALPPPPFTTAASTTTTRYPTASRYLAYDAITGQSMALPTAARNRTQQHPQQQVPQQFHSFQSLF